MKTCNGCKYAEWKKTKAERLHPSGDGMCRYPYKVPQLPESQHWVSGSPPAPAGGFINRRHKFDRHCAYWTIIGS